AGPPAQVLPRPLPRPRLSPADRGGGRFRSTGPACTDKIRPRTCVPRRSPGSAASTPVGPASRGSAGGGVGPSAVRARHPLTAWVGRRSPPEGRAMSDKAAESATSTSLLMGLQQAPADQVVWAEFVRRYGSRIHGWCRRWGLQE